MNIVVMGAGAWGTAMAVQASQRHTVTLLARDAAHARAMQGDHANTKYLPGVALPTALRFAWPEAMPADTWAAADLVVVATPMNGLRHALAHSGSVTAVWLCKGLELGTGLLGHEIAAAVCPGRATAVLSGPSFADEVARSQPTALVAASVDAGLAERVAQVFRSDALRVYSSDDPVGVEVGGAVKNVLAIATGLCDGLGADDANAKSQRPQVNPGLNARAALITRGLAEMTRLGVALGAQAPTFMGLSGLGDLVLTATGALSRNRQVGLGLAQGRPLAQVLASLGHVAEGVTTAPVVWSRAQRLGVDMPITQAVVAVLQGDLTPAQGVQQLMTRDPKREHG
jgi:glycerol-3-phosphate dehydrogenase (NAD(P)+)